MSIENYVGKLEGMSNPYSLVMIRKGTEDQLFKYKQLKFNAVCCMTLQTLNSYDKPQSSLYM